jgi:GT2 family glycosyltransferase
MNDSLQATILIPTYNRADYLKKCLDAIAHLHADRRSFEVVVVDNNSTDKTREVVTDFANAHADIAVRYVLELEQGVSNARNRGVKESAGEVICLLDDDSPPDPEWLAQLMEQFDDPSVGVAGGPSILDFQGRAVPPWLKGDLKGLISGYGLPFTTPTQVTRWEQFPLSCNMGIRKKALNEVASFRGDLGRIGHVKLTGGETDLTNRIHKAGWKIMYVPGAKVMHLVSPERLEKSYIYKIGYGHAASHIILTSSAKPLMALRWLASDTWYATRRFFWFILSLLQRKPLWFDDYMRFWMIYKRIPLRIKALLFGKSAIGTSPAKR